MTLLSTKPTSTNAWGKLSEHFNQISTDSIKDYFKNNPERANDFKIEWQEFYFDYSKNKITKETMDLLEELAKELNLKDAIDKYFAGDKINETEDRAVLHTALRDFDSKEIFVDGENIIPEVKKVRQKIEAFSRAIIQGERKGYTGKRFTDVVNIGIGGSDLGPQMVVDALKGYKNHLKVHFISNVEPDHNFETIKALNPETTLFVIVSKTFTTQETLTNALTAKDWFLQKAPEEAIASHFVAVSTNLEKIADFGISSENVFPMWNWVGGRFSLWSAVGLTISLAVGYENFENLLRGAFQMDKHFKEEPFQQNIPVVRALLTIWYNNFFNVESEAILPYSQYLLRFAPYLQQGIMESNGKYVDRNGDKVDYQTGTIIWGEPGTNAQHAFFQLIHQGTKLIPADFIGFINPIHGNVKNHDKLMSNFFAQTEALLMGKTKEQVVAELGHLTEKDRRRLTPYKVFEGDKPTNTFLIEKLTPKTLGSLIACYEHKIFVQGIIWNIFSYDQWGVELGKQLASSILSDIDANKAAENHDLSTKNLLNLYLNKR